MGVASRAVLVARNCGMARTKSIAVFAGRSGLFSTDRHYVSQNGHL